MRLFSSANRFLFFFIIAALIIGGTALTPITNAIKSSGQKPAVNTGRKVMSGQQVRDLLEKVKIRKSKVKKGEADDRMSPMGRLAARAGRNAAASETLGSSKDKRGASTQSFSSEGNCVNEPDCEEGGETDGPAAGQAETAIAVDETGQHIVLGFNDGRGFSLNPVSVSGYMYSDDGGQTFTDGGQLPSPGNESVGNTKLPQVFGDPDIKYLGNGVFIYSSILVKKFQATGFNATTVQTMGIHRSTDYGHTWTGPYEVTSATNPGDLISSFGNPLAAGDKEFIDVDPDTGRVIMSWSNFTPSAPGGVEIVVTYSDDIKPATPPTWSPRVVVANDVNDGQASIPRFAGNGSPNAYVTWRRFPSFYTNNVAFSRSTDNGVTWSAPVEIRSEFFTMDQVLGNDRVNTSPGMAVDNSPGPYKGNVYVVYSNNNLRDGSDVSFQRSTDGGISFSAPMFLNSRPGNDRPQWFPWVTVDKDTGRVWVFYYDQGIADSGDLTEVTYTYSDNGGVNWSKPAPLHDRPFHAGYGNDTGQPNLGDYNQAVAQGGEFFAVYAATDPVVTFTNGQPSSQFTTPDVFFKRLSQSAVRTSLRAGALSFTDSGGNGLIDAGDRVFLRIPLVNYVTNPLNASTVSGINATLSTTTPGVSVLRSSAFYPNIAAGGSAIGGLDFVLQLSPTFVPGTPIELVLDVTSGEGSVRLLLTQSTGTPIGTTIFSEDFDSVSPGSLPAGWVVAHGGGANVVPWTTSSTFPGTSSNGAFHQNAEDGPKGGSPTRWERLFSPVITVPANADYVTADFDVAYDTEEDPNFNVLAYDGFFLRYTDVTPGRTLRSLLAEAFVQDFTTNGFFHYPKHFPRSSNPNYFQDMSAWAGFSDGVKHVHMKLPGMAGSKFQLRFEYTQDGGGTCADIRPGHTCGVFIDNVVIRSVVSTANELARLTLKPVPGPTPGVYSGVVTSQVPAPRGGITVNLSSNYPDKVTMPATVTIPEGATASAPFTVTLDPTFRNVLVTITATGPSNSRSAGIIIK